MAAPFSTHAVSSLSISPDSSRIATACGDDSATILVSVLPQEKQREKFSSLGPSPDSSALETGACITSLAWDGNSRLYTTDTRGSLTLYSALTTSIPGISRLNQIVAAHSGHSLTGVAASPNLVVTTAKDGLVKAWDPDRSTCIARLKGHKGESRAIALGSMDNDMHLLVSAGRDKTVRVWDVRINNAGSNANSSVAVLEGHQGWVHDVAMCAGNRPRIVSCAGDKTVRIWDMVAMKLESVKSGHEFRVWTVAADAAGKFAVSGSTDTTVRFWDLGDTHSVEEDGTKVWEAHGDSVLSVSVAKDSSFAVSASENGSVVKWDIAKMLRGDNNNDDDNAQLVDTFAKKTTPEKVQHPKRKTQSPVPKNLPPYADSAPLLDTFLQPTSASTKKPTPVAASPPLVAQKKRTPIVTTTKLLAPVSLDSTSNININSPRHHLRVRTSPSSSREARSSPGSGKTWESTPEKEPAVRRARNLSDDLRGNRILSPPRTSGSPRKEKEREARIKTLEGEVVQREMELAERDSRLRQLEVLMMRRDREMETLRKQVESAENLAKQANVRALAAEHRNTANSTSSISTSVDIDGTGGGSGTLGGELDYSESIDRIERVTGKLRALAAKLDGM